MNTLITLLVVIIVFGLIWWLIDLTPVVQPWKNIIKVVVALIIIVYLVTRFLGYPMP